MCVCFDINIIMYFSYSITKRFLIKDFDSVLDELQVYEKEIFNYSTFFVPCTVDKSFIRLQNVVSWKLR